MLIIYYLLSKNQELVSFKLLLLIILIELYGLYNLTNLLLMKF